MRRHAVLATLALALLLPPLQGLAETRRFCEQTMAYSVAPPDSMCVAPIVENIRPVGGVETRRVWLAGTGTGIWTLASLGAAPWPAHVEGEMTGWFIENSHRTPSALKWG
jgi:hypothetical protein